MNHLKYRADIDGLRAVAVIPVILYHAGFSLFSGGFVGVDVFFVISGFLITSLIAAEIEARDFSIIRFYERRVRRILPALFVVMAVSMIAGWIILLPEDYMKMAASVTAASAFVSNVFFWRQVGYFDTPAAEKPLLHTWSLSVEEQFYIVFPLFLLALCRWCPKWRRQVIALVAAGSFALSVLYMKKAADAAFYLAHLRAWELLAGSLVALGAFPTLKSVWMRDAAAIAGLAMIAFAVFSYSNLTAFPGIAALPPVIGTVLLIWTGGARTTAHRILTLRPAIFIGKISYSLYLWHYPLLAYGAYLSIDALHLGERLGFILAAVVLAYFSWRFVEQPIRKSGPAALIGRKPLFSAACLLFALLIGTGLAVDALDGAPGRIAQTKLAAVTWAPNDCYVDKDKIAKGRICKIGAKNNDEPRFALWGDSHANVLRPGLTAAAMTYGQSGVFLGKNGCSPVMATGNFMRKDCKKYNTGILSFLTRNETITDVILAGRWAMRAEGVDYERNKWMNLSREKGPPRNSVGKVVEQREAFADGLAFVVNELLAAGKRVWLIGPVPEIGYNVPQALYLKARGFDADVDIDPTIESFMRRQDTVFSVFNDLKNRFPIQILWPHQLLCGEAKCLAERDGQAFYWDAHHLSVEGSTYLKPLYDPIFAKMTAKAE